MVVTEHVHNRRQIYMTNSLLDIGARTFGIVTPVSRYRLVILDILRLYRYTKDTYFLVFTTCTRNILKDFANLRKIFDIFIYIYKYITCSRSIYKEIRVLYIMTRLYLEAGVSIPKARATISNKLLVIDFWRRL